MSWPRVKLSEVATLINGRAYKKHEMLSEGKYPLMRVGNFFSNRAWFYSDLELPERQYCDHGDLLYAWSASFGPRIWDGGKVIYHYHIWKLVLNEERIHKKYLYYALQRDVDLIKQEQGSGSTMIHVTKTAMEEREITLPPLDEQKRIAAILDKADAIRRKRQQAIQLADDFLRSVFLDMFGDPETNPKEWEVKLIWQSLADGDIESIQDGNHGNDHPKVSDFVSSGIPFIAANVVRKGKILFDKCYYLAPTWLDKLRIGFAKPRDVLLSHKGTLGLTAVLDSSYDTYIFSPQTTYYRLNENKILPEYLKAYFDSTFFQRLMAKEGKQSTRAYIGITRQKDLPIMLPPMAEQKKFVQAYKVAQSIESKSIHSELDNENLFNSLSQKAFSGEL